MTYFSQEPTFYEIKKKKHKVKKVNIKSKQLSPLSSFSSQIYRKITKTSKYDI